MALKVMKEYGVTVGGAGRYGAGVHYPLGAAVERTDTNAAEIEVLVLKGYLIEAADEPDTNVAPAPKKSKGGK